MPRPDRNERCPCGSGKRYKDCHGSMDAASPPSVAETAPDSETRVGVVVAGTQKGGTSALKTCMIEHPEIGMPKEVKEVHFFDTEENFATPNPDYAAYHALYARDDDQQVLADATPIYMFWEPAPLRIWQYNPAMKFIVMLRNPATRAYSHWNMEIKQRRETLPFDEAIRTETQRCRAQLPLQHRRWSYIARGMYSEQLRRIWRHFPRQQTLVLKSEDFRSDPAPGLARIAEFLGVGVFPRVAPRKVFALPYDAPMSVGARRFLLEIFEFEILRLERLLDWDCSDWLAQLRSD